MPDKGQSTRYDIKITQHCYTELPQRLRRKSGPIQNSKDDNVSSVSFAILMCHLMSFGMWQKRG